MPQRLLAPAAMATLLYLAMTTTVSAETPSTMNAEQGWSAIARCAQEDTERGRHTCLDRVLRDAGLLTPEMHAQQQRRAFGLDDKPARAPTPPAPTAAISPNAATSANAAAPTARTSATATAPTARTSATATAPTAKTSATAASASAPAATTGAVAARATTAPAAAIEPSKSVAPAPTTAAPSDRLEVELTAVEKAANGMLIVTTKEGALWLQAESVQMPQPPLAGDHMTIRKGSLGGYRCSVVSTHLTYRCTRSR